MKVTLNKDGTPRKIGSGKTKGAGSFAKIKWEQLREFVKEDQDIVVSRVWLRSVGALSPKRRSKKKGPLPPASMPSNSDKKGATPSLVKTAPKLNPSPSLIRYRSKTGMRMTTIRLLFLHLSARSKSTDL